MEKTSGRRVLAGTLTVLMVGFAAKSGAAVTILLIHFQSTPSFSTTPRAVLPGGQGARGAHEGHQGDPAGVRGQGRGARAEGAGGCTRAWTGQWVQAHSMSDCFSSCRTAILP